MFLTTILDWISINQTHCVGGTDKNYFGIPARVHTFKKKDKKNNSAKLTTNN